MQQHPIIAFIGGGRMTQSLLGGLKASAFQETNIWVSDPQLEKLKKLNTQFGVQIDPLNVKVANVAEVLVLAVKPQDMRQVALELKDTIQKKKPLIISIAAGIKTHHLEHWLSATLPIVRAMPNTPALLGVGATGLYANTRVSPEQKDLAESLLRAVGVTVWLNHEHDMDVVTALSGSGPAYFFLIMETLQQEAEALGLPNRIARLLTLQTALGAARMALESDISLKELINHIASPNGTTETALNTLERGGVRALFKKALQSAKDRSIEISHLFDQE